MTQVAVQRLRFRGAPDQASRAEFHVADALRTGVPDDGRLILVRSFALGRIGSSNHGASLAASAAWRDMLATAKHGGSDGAGQAGCVWFSDSAEARTLLLRALAFGRMPEGWFWPLAVPEWRGLALDSYLDQRLRTAMATSSGEAIRELLAEAMAAHCVEQLAQALSRLVPASPAAREYPAASRGAAGKREALAGQLESAPHSAPADLVAAMAGDIVAAMPSELRKVLGTISRAAGRHDDVKALARALVLHSHPALALSAAASTEIVAAVVQALAVPSAGRRQAKPSQERTPLSPTHCKAEQPFARMQPLLQEIDDAADLTDAGKRGEWREKVPAELDRAPEIAQAEPQAVEQRSEAAGIFLVIVPLIRLGWREWLVEHEQYLAWQPGPRLLDHVASHYRVAPRDPLWGLLPPFDQNQPVPTAFVDDLAMWRAGLDRWLRRKVRRKLADCVGKPGWIKAGEDCTTIRFPLDAIDIALRRHALDVDPGWVDWLGHSFRFVYRQRPLVGGGA